MLLFYSKKDRAFSFVEVFIKQTCTNSKNAEIYKLQTCIQTSRMESRMQSGYYSQSARYGHVWRGADNGLVKL